MGSIQELQVEGWHVSGEGYELITENGKVKDKKAIITNALNTDIKEFGDPVLTTEIKLNSTGKVILQIQKIRNIAAPKSKEDSQGAPRMLKITLTDGHTSCQAVEIASVSSLSRTHTPPGSKLLINSAQIFSSCILLNSNCCTLLGGRVPALYEKWELAKDISVHVRVAAGPDGPPPWVNFGEKIISFVSNEPFKSLITKTTKETTNEFDVHRQDAIAVASTGAVKKVFGGGTKVAQEYESIPTIYRKYNPVRNVDNQSGQDNANKEYSRGFKGRREMKEKVIEKPQKPPEKISLFDFLEDKLLVNESDAKPNSKTVDDNNFFKQETQRPANRYKEGPRNFSGSNYAGSKFTGSNFSGPNFSGSNSPRFQQQKYQKPHNFNRNYPEPAPAVNSYRSENFVNPTPVELASKSFAKMSLNSQFASRSLQQHLNLGNNRNEYKSKVNSSSGTWNWRVGDLCMAKYWEDGKYYNATVTNLTERTCVVQFNGYGNVEEVLKTDCIPISDEGPESHLNHANINQNFKGPMGFRNGRRPYSNNRPFNKPT